MPQSDPQPPTVDPRSPLVPDADGNITPESVNARLGELAGMMGIRVTEVGPGRLVATMPVEGNRQPFGILHGGASCVLAESVGSIAAAIHGSRIGRMPVGVDINATHHRAASAGVLTAECTPLHEGGLVATYQVVLVDEKQRAVCTSRLTCNLLPAPPSAGR